MDLQATLGSADHTTAGMKSQDMARKSVREWVKVVVHSLGGLAADGSVNLSQVVVDLVEQFQRDGAITVG